MASRFPIDLSHVFISRRPDAAVSMSVKDEWTEEVQSSRHHVVTSASLLCSVDRNKYQIQIPLPPKIDPTVTMMTVEEKPDVTYSDIGGCKEQIEKMREVVELPMLHPEKFVQLGIDPPKGVLCYGPPGGCTQPTKKSQRASENHM